MRENRKKTTHVARSERNLDDTTELCELLCGVGLNVGNACGSRGMQSNDWWEERDVSAEIVGGMQGFLATRWSAGGEREKTREKAGKVTCMEVVVDACMCSAAWYCTLLSMFLFPESPAYRTLLPLLAISASPQAAAPTCVVRGDNRERAYLQSRQ